MGVMREASCYNGFLIREATRIVISKLRFDLLDYKRRKEGV
jgi:hypothetical protein